MADVEAAGLIELLGLDDYSGKRFIPSSLIRIGIIYNTQWMTKAIKQPGEMMRARPLPSGIWH